MSKYYLIHQNPVACGYCTHIHRSDYDVDNELVLGRTLLSEQALGPALVEYAKSEFVLWVEPKDFGRPMLNYYSLSTKHIVSRKFRELLDQHNVDAEYVAIRVLDETNNEAGEFLLAHFLTMVACFDADRSTDTHGPYQPGYDVTAIHEGMLSQDVLLFREKEKLKNKVFVHESLKVAIEAAGIKGILFLPLPADGWETGQLIRKLEEDCIEQ